MVKITRGGKRKTSGPRETPIMQAIRAEVNAIPDVRVWRNNSGALNDDTGRLVRYGLGKGSPDLIGIAWGRFIAFEVKVPGRKPTHEQEIWIDMIKEFGGAVCVVHSVVEALEFLWVCAREWGYMPHHPLSDALQRAREGASNGNG
jgi:hypothetical protein